MPDNTPKKNHRARTRALIAVVALVLVVAVGLVALANRDRDPFRADDVQEPPFTPLTYAVQGFFWWDEGMVGTHLDWVRMLGFNTIKQTFAWRDMEPEPGVWDFSQSDRILSETERRDLYVIARLGQTPAWAIAGISDEAAADDLTDAPPDDLSLWDHYCATVAGRYAGRIHAYQIWNEPNLSREWGDTEPDAAGYVDLLRRCSEAIRAADPDAIIISAGLAPTGDHSAIAHRDDLYLQAMYDAGFQQYADVVGAHAPGFSAPELGPDEAEAAGRGRWATFRRVEDLRRIMVENGDAARQMAILEFGWTTDPVNEAYTWFSVSEEQQAANTVAAYDYALEHWRPWVGLMTLIYLPKPTWTPDDEEYWWAIADTDGHIRPVFGAVASMPKVCGDITLPYRPEDHPEFTGHADPTTCP